MTGRALENRTHFSDREEGAMFRYRTFIAAILGSFTGLALTHAATMTFFSSDQVATLVTEGPTWDKISSNGYYFTYTLDKFFNGGGGGPPTGRYVRIPWPQGVEAQAVTAGPNPGKAKITIERVDGDVFDINAFSAKLLANTGGAGADFEVVPFLNGEEVLPNPVIFNATGYYGQTFSYNTTPNPWGQSTLPLAAYDKYSIDLYVDFAWTALTLIGAPIPTPPGDYNQNYVVDAADYVVWRKNNWPSIDYDTWRSHFGQTSSGDAGATASAAVPEPTTMMLMSLAAASEYLRRRRAA
jgi:hypothetical protein